MFDDLKMGLLMLLIALLFFAGVMWLGAKSNAWKCEQKWADSGMEYQYSWGGGCRIKTPAEVWIPAENYREI